MVRFQFHWQGGRGMAKIQLHTCRLTVHTLLIPDKVKGFLRPSTLSLAKLMPPSFQFVSFVSATLEAASHIDTLPVALSTTAPSGIRQYVNKLSHRSESAHMNLLSLSQQLHGRPNWLQQLSPAQRWVGLA